MSWEQRGSRRIYYRSERSGNRARRVYVGSGPIAELTADYDHLRRLERQDRDTAWRDEQARHEAADTLIIELENVAVLLVEAALTHAGFHRHDRGRWRRRRVMKNVNLGLAAGPFTSEDIREVLEAARRGDRSVLPALRQWLDARPDFFQHLGDVAGHAERAWIELAAGTDLVLSEAITRKLQSLKAELAGPGPTPLETLLVDRVAATWLQVHHADVMFRQAKDRNLTLAQLDHLQRRMVRAQRSYLAAVKALATIKRLLPTVPRPVIDGPECVAETLRRTPERRALGGQRSVSTRPPR